MNPPTTPRDAKTEPRRGRGMNTAPGSTQALQRLAGALKTRLDLDTYRAILANLTWPFVVQAVVATRSYTAGFDAALRLLEFADAHRDHLAAREIDALEKEVARLTRDLGRYQALSRAAQRAAGLTRPRTDPIVKANGKVRKRRKPVARALKAAVRLRDEEALLPEEKPVAPAPVENGS